MSAVKDFCLLSLLAISLAPRETEAQVAVSGEWSKFGQCAQVVITTVAELGKGVVPTVYELKTCSGYVGEPAPVGHRRSVLWYFKVTYEFFKKVVLDKPKCLLDLLNKVAKFVKPYADQITAIGCLDENDFVI